MPERSVTISLPHGFTIGGVTTWALNLAKWLGDSGCKVRIVNHPPLVGHQAFEPQIGNSECIKIVDAPSLEDDFDQCLAIYRSLLPTTLFPNLSPLSYEIAATLSIGHPEKLRVLSFAHGDNPADYAYLEYYESIVHHFVAVSSACEAELKKRLPHRSNDIRILNHAVDAPDFIERPAMQVRPIRIIYAGRIEQGIKRITDLLGVAALLRKRQVPFHMRLVGDGPHTNMIDNLIKINFDAADSDSPYCVERLPPIPPHEMSRLWKWADVFLLTSRLEGFSVSMLEAMAHGCVPVVTRISSGVGDIIRDGKNGLTFPVADIDAAADTIAQIATDESRMCSISISAYGCVRDQFNHDTHTTALIDLVSDAASAPSRSWSKYLDLRMPPVAEPEGAIISDEDTRYRNLINFIQLRPQKTKLVVYGLGANGLTLLERMKRDPRIAERSLFVADDSAHSTIFELTRRPRVFPAAWQSISSDTLIIVTPNDASRIAERLIARGAMANREFLCLNDLVREPDHRISLPAGAAS